MWTIAAYRRTHSPSWLASSEGRQLELILHSSHEPGELPMFVPLSLLRLGVVCVNKHNTGFVYKNNLLKQRKKIVSTGH